MLVVFGRAPPGHPLPSDSGVFWWFCVFGCFWCFFVLLVAVGRQSSTRSSRGGPQKARFYPLTPGDTQKARIWHRVVLFPGRPARQGSIRSLPEKPKRQESGIGWFCTRRDPTGKVLPAHSRRDPKGKNLTSGCSVPGEAQKARLYPFTPGETQKARIWHRVVLCPERPKRQGSIRSLPERPKGGKEGGKEGGREGRGEEIPAI